jgi:hypothetical protein
MRQVFHEKRMGVQRTRNIARLRGIEFIGVQHLGESKLALFNDPETGTTFSLHAGETIGEAIAHIRARFTVVTKSVS